MRMQMAVLAGMMAAGAWLQAPVVANMGVEAGSGIQFALLSLEGRFVEPRPGERSPRLTAQCTKDGKGKLRFELLADLGDVPELRFMPPWRPTPGVPGEFPPMLPHATVTMEFLGYTKVKPVKRQWVAIDGLAGEWKYGTPGLTSGNMEEIGFYMQYLKALPTLRLTFPSEVKGKSPVMVEFETAKWQAEVRTQPLCGASGL